MENNSRISEILHPGKSVQIELKNDYGNKLIRKATVNWLDNFYLLLNLPNKGNVFEHVSSKTDIVIICKHNEEQPDYVFFTKFIRILEMNPPMAILQTPSGFNKGRQAVRFDVAVPFSYFMGNREFKEGMVHNLSMNGLLASIKPNQELNERDHMAFKLFIPNSAHPLLLSGKINRIIKQEQKYQIAMHFPYLAFDIQDKIVKFLFSAQKKNTLRTPEPPMDLPKNDPAPYRKIG